jgi:23S rRNA (adenine2503-C2)-methyltransferase
MNVSFYDLNLSDLENVMKEWGEPVFRAKQIWQFVYKKLYLDPQLWNTVPKELRNRFSNEYDFHPVTEIKNIQSEDKQTEKILLQLSDGKKIEAVLMRYYERNTICISSQAGCAMNCAFCATGQMGFIRNLSVGEIVGQVLFFAEKLKLEEKKLTNIVIMGMGEPFHNYDHVMKAIDIINDSDGFQFGERRITISTVGIIPMIEKFTKAKRQINLAVSLHAPTSKIRDQIIPSNKKYPLEQLIETCKTYTEKTGRRITFEYALIHGFNDSPEEAALLAKLLKGMLCHVNLIPLNSTIKFDQKGSSRERTNDFKMMLDKYGIACSIRLKRGVDIGAGCGQLLTSSSKNE